MEETHTLEIIPRRIKTAEYLVYASLIVGLIKSVLYETITTQKVLSNPTNLTVAIITFIIIGFLGFKIGKGMNWARITLFVLFIIGMILYPFFIGSVEFQVSPVIGLASIFQMLIQLYVLILLFTGKSIQWYKDQKLKTTPNKKYSAFGR